MSAGLGLSGQAEKVVPRRTGWECFRLGAQPNNLGGESVFEDIWLFETTPLHGPLFRERKAGALQAFTSQVKATYRAVMIRS
jgi:hypothetical protein